VLSNLNEVSRVLAARGAAIDSGVVNASKTMENTARLTAELPRLVERIEASAAAVDRMANEMARVSASAAATLEGARAEARQISGETVPEARAVLADLRELTGSLRRLADQIERHPAMLVHGRSASKKGPGE
jgi:phospholipid/cholesterol/gamma-HCH transport system substrate-binding protein